MGKPATLKLSVLDQSPIRQGGTPADALNETIQLAKFVETLGFHRYWLAEHHSTAGLAGPAPEIMVTRIAAETTEIRVGSGGVMLPHYSPYKVAESFRVLETLYPGRIDLGIGRAPGSDYAASRALAYGNQISAEYFPNMVLDLERFLHDTLPSDHPFAQVQATPKTESAPPIWLLGSSEYSGAYAAHFGLAFSFAHFINPAGGDSVMRTYFEKFDPSDNLQKPAANIGVFVVCADTEEDAQRVASTRDLQRLRSDRGDRGPMPSIEESLAYPYTDAEREHIGRNRARITVGAPEQVKAELLDLAGRYGVDEVIAITNVYNFADRKRSYELLAEAFGLEARKLAQQ